MNTEQQLRHAAEQMDRATASLTPPPLAKLHRSARMRTIGVSVAAAVGAVVLIGGVVLALRPSGETTLTPAGPTETTVAPVDGIPILIPELDPAPLFDLGPDAKEIVWQEPGETLADDVRENASAEWLDEVVHVVFGGAVGEQRLYDFVGGVGADEVGGEPRWSGACLVEYGPGGTSGASCGDRDARGSVGGGFRIGTDGLMTVSVSGRAPIRSSVAVLEIDGTVYWRRTRDGYFVLSADASPDANVRYVIYDSGGGVLAGSTIGVTNELADEVADAATQTTEAVTDPGDTCSGARFFPDVDTAGVPEPVIQTLGQIMLFGSRCWFEDLAAISPDNFAAGFGGEDAEELWTYEEGEGYAPMHSLMQILNMPYGTTEVDGRVLYIWPAAAAHDGGWNTVPEEDKEALRPLYDDDDFAGFESFGAYIGYRTGIYEDGDWSFLVVGD